MKATKTRNYPPSGVCDYCHASLGERQWLIEDDDLYGYFCRRSCAEAVIERYYDDNFEAVEEVLE